MLLDAVADCIYLFQRRGTYLEGTCSTSSGRSALLSPVRLDAATRRARVSTVAGRPCSPFPAAARCVATVILVYDHFVRLNLLAVGLATATLALSSSASRLTFRENRRLFELTRHEATTDALTGLGEPSELLDDLERASSVTRRPGRS